jgi:hypothetical protein
MHQNDALYKLLCRNALRSYGQRVSCFLRDRYKQRIFSEHSRREHITKEHFASNLERLG